MGAFSGNFSGNGSPWSNVTSATSSSSTVYTYTTGAGGTFSASNLRIPVSVPDIREIALDVRKSVEELCNKSEHFNGNMVGICGIASRQVFKEIKKLHSFLPIDIGYINRNGYRHIFCIARAGNGSLRLKEDYLIDITADIYGEDSVVVAPLDSVDIASKPWWDTLEFYTSESGLMARQRKDRWPHYQISINAAKAQKQQIEIITRGNTDIQAGKLRVAPPDDACQNYLQKISKGNLLKLNLAKLMLDPDPEVRRAANKIAKIVTSR
jgi:hypothetical protein